MLTLLFFSHAHANNIDTPIDENDSIYKYSALENKLSFRDFPNNTDVASSKEQSIQSNNVSTEPGDVSVKLENITERQNFSIEQINNAMNVLTNRDKVTTFFIGNNLGILKFQLVQIKDMIYSLEDLSLKSSTNKIEIDNQVNLLKEEEKKVEDFLLEQENKFSLFGWFVNIL